MPHRPRRGIALVLALATLLVMGGFAGVVFLFSRSATREVDVLGNHLRAMAVADAAYARTASRLCATGWNRRWFASGPDTQLDVEAAGGSYSATIKDAPALSPTNPGFAGDIGQADLLVRATYGKSSVVCFWRLSLNRDGLDDLMRVVPRFFVYPPEELASATVDPVSQHVGALVQRRQTNAPGFERRRLTAAGAKTAGEIASLMGDPPVGRVVDGVAPMGSGPERPNSGYVPVTLPPPTARLPLDGPWTQAPFRRNRTGGPEGWGSRPDPGSRPFRGENPEIDSWSGWGGWPGRFGRFTRWIDWTDWARGRGGRGERGNWGGHGGFSGHGGYNGHDGEYNGDGYSGHGGHGGGH